MYLQNNKEMNKIPSASLRALPVKIRKGVRDAKSSEENRRKRENASESHQRREFRGTEAECGGNLCALCMNRRGKEESGARCKKGEHEAFKNFSAAKKKEKLNLPPVHKLEQFLHSKMEGIKTL
jgi:hypothetical protein